MEAVVFLNGKLVPRSKAYLSPFDHGFLYGYGLFETMRAYHGRLFQLERHIARLMNSAQELGFASKLSAAELRVACVNTLIANRLDQAALRLTVSIGEGKAYPDPSTCRQPTIFVVARRYIPPSAKAVKRGFSAVLSSHRRDSQSLLSQTKTISYLLSYLARREARGSGVDEVLLLNERGFLAEGSISNVFMVRGGVLLTPDFNSGILPGVTRQIVLELASSLGIAAIEAELRPEALFGAEEAFVTNSLIEIMPLTRVDGQAIGSGKPGAVTARLRDAYRGLVEKETNPAE